MNNRGTVTSAQIAGRAPKISAKLAAKPRTKPAPKPAPKPGRAPKIGAKSAAKPRTKPAPKPGMKRKHAEVEDRGGEGKELSPRQLRSRIY